MYFPREPKRPQLHTTFVPIPGRRVVPYRQAVEVEPVTTDRYGRTVAFVKVGDNMVKEKLIRQGLARVFTRYCDRAICEGWDRKL